MKNKKILFSLFLSTFLFSCTNKNYLLYIGPMFESVLKENISDDIYTQYYNNIDGNKIETYKDAREEKGIKGYKYQVNIIEDKNDLDAFYSSYTDYIDKDKEIKKYNINIENEKYVYIIAQIPKGFKVADKKDNIQTTIDGDEILVNPDFYFYEKDYYRLYSIIDIEKNEDIVSDSLYSYFYKVSTSLKENLSKKTVKVMYRYNINEESNLEK